VTGSVLIPGKLGKFAQQIPPGRQGIVMQPNRFGGTFVLYELVKKKDAATLPVKPADVKPERVRGRRGGAAATEPVDEHAGELFPNVPAKK